MWILACLAHASDWSVKPVEPRYATDFTAYSLEKSRFRVGVISLDYGLLKNASIGTTPLLYLFGAPNLRAKVTAIQSEKVDASFEAGFAWRDFDGLLLTSWPLQANMSWILSERVSMHVGGRWENVTLAGEASLDQIGEAAAVVLQTDLGPQLAEALANAGTLYAGGQLSLFQGQFAMDYRLNRRDSLILQWKGWLHLRARIDAGYETEEGNVRIGPSAQVDEPLDDEAIGVTTIAWQFSWEHMNLRLGIGIPGEGYGKAGILAVLEQGFEIAYVY